MHSVDVASFTVISSSRAGSPVTIQNEGQGGGRFQIVFWANPVIVPPRKNDAAFGMLREIYATLDGRVV